jgi:hypothetical protein
MADIFVSHSHADGELAAAIVRYMELRLGATARSLFFQSSDVNRGLESGVYVNHTLIDTLQRAPVLVAMITPRFYRSAYCMGEVGYFGPSDGKERLLIPIAVQPITVGDLRGFLAGTNAKILRREELDRACGEIRVLLDRRGVVLGEEAAADALDDAWRAVKSALPTVREPLREIAGAGRYRHCYPDQDGRLRVLGTSTARELERTQQFPDPELFGAECFPWDSALQIVAEGELDGNFHALKIVVMSGRVTPETSNRYFMHTSIGKASEEGAVLMTPVVVRSRAGATCVMTVPDAVTRVRPTDSQSRAGDELLREVTWTAYPAQVNLEPDDGVHMLVTTFYQENYLGDRTHEFWTLATHRNVRGVPGVTRYLFVGVEELEYVRQLFTYPFGQAPGFSLVEPRSVSARFSLDPTQIEGELQLIREHVLKPLPSDRRNTPYGRMVTAIANYERGKRDFSFFVDQRLDDDIMSKRLLVFSHKAGADHTCARK